MIDKRSQTRLYEQYMLECWEAWSSALAAKKALKEGKKHEM